MEFYLGYARSLYSLNFDFFVTSPASFSPFETGPVIAKEVLGRSPPNTDPRQCQICPSLVLQVLQEKELPESRLQLFGEKTFYKIINFTLHALLSLLPERGLHQTCPELPPIAPVVLILTTSLKKQLSETLHPIKI